MTDVALAAGPPRPDAPAMRLTSAERNAAFVALYTAAFRDVSGYCAALLKDTHLGGDIAQEAFVRLFARWRSIDNPRGFVFLVATNLVRDEWRRQGRQRTLLSSIQPLVDEAAPASDETALRDIVLRLPRKQRDVVVLHLIADLPVAEVARVAGIPVGTVKRRLHDARSRLRLDWTETP